MLDESTDIFRILLALFCCFMAFAVACNLHVRFLHAIGRSLYSTFALLIGFLSLGKVKAAPLAYRTRARQRRKIRELRMQWEDWRWRRSHQEPKTAGGGGWAVISDDVDDLVLPGAKLELPDTPANAIPSIEAKAPEIVNVEEAEFISLDITKPQGDEPPSFD